MTHRDSEIPFIPGGSVFVNEDTNIGHCTLCDWSGVPVADRPMDCPACTISKETEAAYRSYGDHTRFLAPVKAAPKVPRNSPCPCGSGKKFKKCHEGREDEL